MNRKKRSLILLASISASVISAVCITSIMNTENDTKGLHANSVWNHYSAQAATPVDFGTKEYWVVCGGTYQLTAPVGATIIDKDGRPDTSEFTEDDPRWDKTLADYNLGGNTKADFVGAYMTDGTTTYVDPGNQLLSGTSVSPTSTMFQYNPYNNTAENPNIWEIGLPRVNFAARNSDLTVSFALVNWAGTGAYALTKEGLTDNSVADNGGTGKLYASLNDNTLYVVFSYNGSTLSKTITDQDVINGKSSITLYAKHSNAGGNAYFGIAGFDVETSLDDLHFGEWSVTREATFTQAGIRSMEDLLHGHIEEEFNYEPAISVNDCASWHEGHFQIVVSNAPKGNYTLAKTNDIYIVRGNEKIYPTTDIPKDLFTCNGTNSQLELNGGWFRRLFSGNWDDSFAETFQDGDIIHFNKTTFTGYDQDDNTTIVSKFDVDEFELILSPDESTGNFHTFTLKGDVKLTNYELGGSGISGTPWYKNSGLQFYAEHLDTLPVYDDSTNVSKFRGLKSSCIQVIRNGVTYNVSKINDGWIDALRKETSENNDRWYVNFGSSSVDLTEIGGSIQSGDVVNVSGIFINHAYFYAVKVTTKLAVRYTLTDAEHNVWTLESVN